MSRARLLIGATGAALVAGVSAKLVSDAQRKSRIRQRGDDIAFGSLHGERHTVTASDGTQLNVEIDDGPDDGPTVVFCHGWMCNLDSWHFQRAALRGQVKMIFFDQRSHGASQRSAPQDCTVEQLGRDVADVIETHAPDGDIILVGHSMGGMTIMSLAAQLPDWFDGRISGVVLCATGAGNLMRGSKAFSYARPLIRRVSFMLDAGRTFNSYSVIRRFALGPYADERYVSMTEEMILKNRSHVLLDFYPMLLELDMYAALAHLTAPHVSVVAGRKDLVTPIRHSRRLVELIDGAELITLEDAGHMVMFEAHETVTATIAEAAGLVA